jgi:hypothetical protein
MRTRVLQIGSEKIAVTTFLALALVPAMLSGAVLWILPVGTLAADRVAVAARDYTDLWAAGRLVVSGQDHVLFDLAEFNAALHSMFGAGFPHQIWPYPPPTLLLAVPLSTLPLLFGFLLYTAGTIGLLWWSLRSCNISGVACAAVLVSPAVADNALAGQNGSLIAALLFGGLSLVHRRPILAGAILGSLIIKPQFGILVLPCLVAARSWRALAGMTIWAALLVVVSGILFGIDAWEVFLSIRDP